MSNEVPEMLTQKSKKERLISITQVVYGYLDSGYSINQLESMPNFCWGTFDQ